MGYKVFISHSAKEQGLVIALSNLIAKYGINVSVAEWYLEPGSQIAKTSLKQIDDADCVIALITPSGTRSEWLHLEIGYALKAGKVVIPLIEKGTEATQLKMFGGLEIIEYDPQRPYDAISKASSYVATLQLKKQEREDMLLIVGGVLAFLLLLSASRE
jgi:nucleoside 2-deoxyribosyltransferase